MQNSSSGQIAVPSWPARTRCSAHLGHFTKLASEISIFFFLHFLFYNFHSMYHKALLVTHPFPCFGNVLLFILLFCHVLDLDIWTFFYSGSFKHLFFWGEKYKSMLLKLTIQFFFYPGGMFGPDPLYRPPPHLVPGLPPPGEVCI